MSQVFLLTGENSFALSEERKRWIKEFCAKHGEENLLRMEGSGIELRELLDAVAVKPFLAEKRLVIVEGIPKFTTEEVQRLVGEVHPDVILLFVEGKPDRRLQGVKELLKVASHKEFSDLSPQMLRRWARSFLSPRGSSIDEDALELLLQTVGADQSALHMELEKLALFAGGKPISRSCVEEICVPSGELVVWNLTDLLALGKTREALFFTHRLLERGEDPAGLWNILLWMLRNLTLVCAAVKDGERDLRKISAKTHVPFPSARALLPLAVRMPPAFLHRLLTEAVEADMHLKTGVYRSASDEADELLTLLERFILRFGEVPALTPSR